MFVEIEMVRVTRPEDKIEDIADYIWNSLINELQNSSPSLKGLIIFALNFYLYGFQITDNHIWLVIFCS